jgi:hypothetical protein
VIDLLPEFQRMNRRTSFKVILIFLQDGSCRFVLFRDLKQNVAGQSSDTNEELFSAVRDLLLSFPASWVRPPEACCHVGGQSIQ